MQKLTRGSTEQAEVERLWHASRESAWGETFARSVWGALTNRSVWTAVGSSLLVVSGYTLLVLQVSQ